jgi:hypothetical protein
VPPRPAAALMHAAHTSSLDSGPAADRSIPLANRRNSRRRWPSRLCPVGTCRCERDETSNMGGGRRAFFPLPRADPQPPSSCTCLLHPQVHLHFTLSSPHKRHYTLLPKAIGQLAAAVPFEEVELSLTQGRWVGGGRLRPRDRVSGRLAESWLVCTILSAAPSSLRPPPPVAPAPSEPAAPPRLGRAPAAGQAERRRAPRRLFPVGARASAASALGQPQPLPLGPLLRLAQLSGPAGDDRPPGDRARGGRRQQRQWQ